MVIVAIFDGDTDYVDDVTSGIPGETSFAVRITNPINALYIMNNEIRKFKFEFREKPVIIGKIDITVEIFAPGSEIDRVEFYINDELKYNTSTEPYTWTWDERTFLKFQYTIEVKAYGADGGSDSDDMVVWRFL